MIRAVFLAFLWIGASAAAWAEGVPDGRYTLGKPIYNGAFVTPRYYELVVVGGVAQVSLTSVWQPDAQMCRASGLCSHTHEAMQFRIEVASDGTLRVADVEMDMETALDARPDHKAEARQEYLQSLLDRFDGAQVQPKAAGFELVNRNGFTPLIPVQEGDIRRLRAWVTAVELSMFQLAGCEVAGVVSLLAAKDASPGHRAFADALEGMAIVQEQVDAQSALYDRESDQPVPNEIRGRRAAYEMGLMLPMIFPDKDLTAPEDYRAAYLEFVEGRKSLAPFAAEVEEVLLPFGPAAAQFQRAFVGVMDSGKDPYRAACADPSFGMVPN